MLLRLGFVLILMGTLSPLRAQNDAQKNDGVVKMKPEFCLTFPLAQAKEGVTVSYPILVNQSTVLKPGMILRVLYTLSYVGIDIQPSDLALAEQTNRERAYSRTTTDSGDKPKMSPELAHEIEGYRRTIWTAPNDFALAMAQYPTESMHLIYSPSGGDSDKDLKDALFGFFDGLLVGMPDGKVRVIGVEKESRTDKAGLKPGDEIIAVGGTPIQNSLDIFSTAYAATKKTAREDEVPSYSMTIRSGDAPPRTVNIAMPPSLKSTFLNGL